MRLIFLLVTLMIPFSASAQNQDNTPPQESWGERFKALEDRLNKIEGAPAKTSLSAFNPAMGMALDMVYRSEDDKASFLFRAAELNVEAPIDPFLKGGAIITGSNSGVDIEEAFLQTTALPYNLQVTGGRLFASFGRLAHFHDHELPTIDRPRSLDTFIGGETQADGVEVSALLPTDLYINAVLGLYNKIGADNDRVANDVGRPLDQFTYLGRLSSYADICDSHSLEVGLNTAWTPKQSIVATAPSHTLTQQDTWRALSGIDLTYRYQPAQGGLYRGVIWGTEIMLNNERRFDPVTLQPTDRERAFGGFSYVQVKVGPRWRPGFMLDLSEDLDHTGQLTKTYTPFLTYDLTEFQRLRLTYSRVTHNVSGMRDNDVIAFQWTGVLGHHVHGFRDR